MTTSREITAKRKSGDLDGAYQDALELKSSGRIDKWGYLSLAWCLYELIKRDLQRENINAPRIKKNLYEYLQLPIEEKPSIIHSQMLLLASKLAKENNLNMLEFIRIWGIENFRDEDYVSYKTDDGKELPSIVEKVIGQASKKAAESNNSELHAYITPYLEDAIKRFPNNIWLRWNKAKILVAMGDFDKALPIATEFAKLKSNEYWVWELLGDISKKVNNDLSLSCYCKALLCNPTDKFSAKVRTKLAQLLIAIDKHTNAKYEIDKILVSKKTEGNKIPHDIELMISQNWYTTTIAVNSNREFYNSNIEQAENLVYADISWLNANLGETFQSPKTRKSIRKLYIEDSSNKYPQEVSVAEKNIFNFSSHNPGDTLKIKGEFEKKYQFSLYLIKKRTSGARWDLFRQKEFNEKVKVQNGMGFTKNHIFIPPPLISEYQVKDGKTLSGLALWTLDRKKKKMGWKAVSINKVKSL